MKKLEGKNQADVILGFLQENHKKMWEDKWKRDEQRNLKTWRKNEKTT